MNVFHMGCRFFSNSSSSFENLLAVSVDDAAKGSKLFLDALNNRPDEYHLQFYDRVLNK